VLAALSSSALGQKLPDKIRGYKVYEAQVRFESSKPTAQPTTEPDATIKIGEPEIKDFGLSGVTFEVGAGIAAMDQSGRVDFLTFKDFRINGIAVDIEEYRHTFIIKKGVATSLPQPAVVFISSTRIAKAGYNEIVGPRVEWKVTGTVFVFGKFKKFGFSFKRVVPVTIDLAIPNPLRSARH